MALLHRPPLLFLDEPTVGADVVTRRQILDLVRDLAADGAAVVYATHYLPEVEEIGSSVAVLEQGRIVARGAVADLVAAHGQAQLRLAFDGPAPALPGFEPDGDGLRRAAADPALLAAEVMRDLGPRASALRSVEIVQPSLEAAYLAITGRSVNEAEGGEETDDVAA
jgi:ABC-2 type transport system ATP-binding protein